MKTIVCPRCNEVLTIPDGKDFIVCPRCGNTIFSSNDDSEDNEEEKE